MGKMLYRYMRNTVYEYNLILQIFNAAVRREEQFWRKRAKTNTLPTKERYNEIIWLYYTYEEYNLIVFLKDGLRDKSLEIIRISTQVGRVA